MVIHESLVETTYCVPTDFNPLDVETIYCEATYFNPLDVVYILINK